MIISCTDIRHPDGMANENRKVSIVKENILEYP